MRRALVTALLAVLAARPAGAAPDDVRVTLDARARPLSEVAEELAARAGRTVAVLPGDDDDQVSCVLRDVPWREALAAVARSAGRRVVEDGETLRLEAPPRVTLQFTCVSVRLALRLLGALAGRSVVVASDVPSTQVTLDLKDAPWDDALDALAAVARLHVVHTGTLTLVLARPPTPREEAALRALSGGPAGPRVLDGGPPRPSESGPLSAGIALPLGRGSERGSSPADPIDGRVDVRDATDAAAVGRAVAAAAGLALSVDPALRLPAPLTLRRAPWREAARLLADLCQARLDVQEGGLALRPRPARSVQASGARLDLLLQVLGARCAHEPPRTPVTADLIGCTVDEAVVGLAVAAGFEPSRDPDGAWRFLRREPEDRPYVPEEEHTYDAAASAAAGDGR